MNPTIITRNGTTLTLHRRDCLPLMRTLPDKAFDLAIVDPPYGIGESRGQHKSRNANRIDTRNGKRVVADGPDYKFKDWDNEIPEASYFTELLRVSENQIIFGGNYFTQFLRPSPCWIVWDKVNGDSDFSDCELAWTSFSTAVRQYEFMWSGMCQGNPSNGRIMQGNKKLNEKRIHPTQKPVALYSWLLAKYAKPGQTILDTHLGSGSIGIACLNHGFNLTACELDEDYFNDAVERIQREAKQEVFDL